MAADEMKKNVEKLDELEESLKKAQEELIVCFVHLFTSVSETVDHNLFLFYMPKEHPDLTPYTLTSMCIFSILFSPHFLICRQGEFV